MYRIRIVEHRNVDVNVTILKWSTAGNINIKSKAKYKKVNRC